MTAISLISNSRPRAECLRSWLFVALIILYPNAVFSFVRLTISDHGYLEAVYMTFGISALIWGGMWLSLVLLREATIDAVYRFDFVVVASGIICALLPISGAAWVGLTGMGLYFLLTRGPNTMMGGVFWCVLALSISGFWARQLFTLFTSQILLIDTWLVASLMGLDSTGNLITAADNRTILQVLEGCSSFRNLSLAVLGWMLARSYFGTSGLARGLVFVSLSMLVIIVINTTRIGIIALRPDLYEIVHGPVGSNAVNILATFAIVAISAIGARQ